jgi:hypothetical protein
MTDIAQTKPRGYLHWLVTLQRSEGGAPECYYILSTSKKAAVARAKRIVGEAELVDVRSV